MFSPSQFVPSCELEVDRICGHRLGSKPTEKASSQHINNMTVVSTKELTVFIVRSF